MFFGTISEENSEESSGLFWDLHEKINWEQANFKTVNFFLFRGILYFDRRLPFEENDLIFIDNDNNALIIIFGSIYNKSQFYSSETASSPLNFPQILLNLFFSLGTNFVKELNGDFVIFIYQPLINRFLIFRDHLGVKPIAYIKNESNFWFSTDIINLCRVFQFEKKLYTEFLLGDFKFIDHKITPNPNVIKLLPGHFLICENTNITLHKYWFPELIHVDDTLSFDKVIFEIKAILYDAIEIRSDKSFVAGTHFSGGLDSTIVGCIARLFYLDQDIFYGFSWSPEDYKSDSIEFDERINIKKTARFNNISPVFINFKNEEIGDFLKNTKKISVSIYEEKVIDEVKNRNVNLIFSGWGGQEFISIGDVGIDIDLIRSFKLGIFIRRNKKKNLRNIIKNIFIDVLFPVLKVLNFNVLRGFRNSTRYLLPPFNNQYSCGVESFYFYNSRKKAHLGYLYNFYISKRTEDWSVNGYKEGIEYRYPLLDHRIVEYMIKVPSKILAEGNNSRLIMRELGRGYLPDNLRLRESTIDPVIYDAFFNSISKLKVNFFDDIIEFKSNPDMFFVNYDLLESDFRNLCSSKNKDDVNNFFLNLYFLKLIHEFTRKYRL